MCAALHHSLNPGKAWLRNSQNKFENVLVAKRCGVLLSWRHMRDELRFVPIACNNSSWKCIVRKAHNWTYEGTARRFRWKNSEMIFAHIPEFCHPSLGTASGLKCTAFIFKVGLQELLKANFDCTRTRLSIFAQHFCGIETWFSSLWKTESLGTAMISRLF